MNDTTARQTAERSITLIHQDAGTLFITDTEKHCEILTVRVPAFLKLCLCSMAQYAKYIRKQSQSQRDWSCHMRHR